MLSYDLLAPAIFILTLHFILGLVDQTDYDPGSGRELIQKYIWNGSINWIVPLAMIFALLIFQLPYTPPIGKILCIIYLIWIVADNVQRWAKAKSDECSWITSSNTVDQVATFKIIFVLFVACASLMLSYGMGPGLWRCLCILLAPILILSSFMFVMKIMSWIAPENPNPEEVIMEYVSAGWGEIAIVRIALSGIFALSLSFLISYLHGGFRGGLCLWLWLLLQPILIVVLYSHKCLYKEVKDKPDISPSCTIDRYGGLRTYLTIMWACICCIILKGAYRKIPYVTIAFVPLLFVSIIGISISASYWPRS